MKAEQIMQQKDVHRRTGGLEIEFALAFFDERVHRRTGGLESCGQATNRVYLVHRRTGGLEMTILLS